MNRTTMFFAGAVALAASSVVVGTQLVSGAESAQETVFVPVAPCRLVDTRPGPPNVGPVAEPIRAGQNVTFGGWGTADADSSCDIPNTATAIATNATAVNPTTRTFVTLYPADVDNPGTSNLNVEAGSSPTPNSANIPLSTTGTFKVYNNAGTVNIVIDVNGYYQPSTAVGATGPAGPQGAPGGTDVGHSFATPDTDDNVGQHVSMVLGANGNPVMSYYDETNDDLKVSACNNPRCTTAKVTTLDSGGDVGAHTSIALGTTGNPVISYYDATNSDVKVAVCDNPWCTDSTNRAVDQVGDYSTAGGSEFSQFIALAVGPTGNPVISYFEANNQELVMAACDDPTCATATITTVDSNGFAGANNSITIGTTGNPVISYDETNNGDLRLAACADPTCSSATITTVDSQGFLGFGNSQGFVGADNSITIGADGNPVISYADLINGDLRIAACTNPNCTDRTITALSAATVFESATSITIGIDGNPIIAYHANNTAMPTVVTCSDRACTTSTVSSIATGEDVGTPADSSIIIGIDGNPVIAFHEASFGDLAVVACGNATCALYA